ncbi:MAG TPA: DUF945 family protein [Burkholderiaceae bacterium]
MKHPIASAVLASTLTCVLPALAQDAPAAPAANAQPKPPQLIDPELLKLYLDVMKDARRLVDHHATLKERVELARHFSFSPDTKAGLQSAFGNDDPLHLTVEELSGGGAAIHGKSDSLDHTDAKNGSTLHLDPITAESIVNRDYSGFKYDIGISELKLTSTGDPKLVDMSNIAIHGDNTVGPYNLPLGKSSFQLERMHIGGGEGAAFALDFNNLAVDADVAARKKVFDARYGYRIASVDWGSDKIENLNADIAILNIDGKSMEDLSDFAETIDFSRQPDAAQDGAQDSMQSDAVMKLFKRFALELSKHNGAVEIRDLSAQYHGQRAGLAGRLTLPSLKQADLDSTQKIYEKLSVRLRLHVPMAMVDDITHRVARSMMEAQARQSGAQVTDVAVDLVARGLISKMDDTLVKQQKWAHMEKDELVTVFELKKGKMCLDGHFVNARSNPFIAMAQGK